MRWIISFFLLHLLKRITQSLIWFSSNHFELFVNTNTLCFWLSSHSPISFPCKLYSMNCDERYKMSYGTLFQNKLISFIRKAEWNFINLFIWCCKMYVTFVYNRMLSKTFFGNRKLFVVCFVFVDLFSWLFFEKSIRITYGFNRNRSDREKIQFCFRRNVMLPADVLKQVKSEFQNENSWT